MKKMVVVTLCLLFLLSSMGVSALTFEDVQEARQKAEEYVKRDGYTVSAQCLPSIYVHNIDAEAANVQQLLTVADSFHFSLHKKDTIAGNISVAKKQSGFFSVDSSRFDGVSPAAMLNNTHTFDEVILLNDQGDYYYLLKTGKVEQVIPANIWRIATDLQFTEPCSLSEFLNAVAYRNEYYPQKAQRAGDIAGVVGNTTEIAYNYIGLSENQRTKSTIMWALSIVCIVAAVAGIGLIGIKLLRR